MGKEIKIIKVKGKPITEWEVTSIGFLTPSGNVTIPFNKGVKLKDILSKEHPWLKIDD